MKQNNRINEYNQECYAPNEFDTACSEPKKRNGAKRSTGPNNQSDTVNTIQRYREDVASSYAGNWAEFFIDWKKSQDKEFELAKQERAALYQQNCELRYKVESQQTLIQQLVDELNQRLEKEKEAEEKRARRAAAKKQPPRDAITPEEFSVIINSVPPYTSKTARVKVALTLLYLTGLRVSNLLELSVLNLQELLQKQSTLIHIIKRGGKRKIIIATEAKHWLLQIEPEIQALITGRNGPQEPLFTNQKGQLISRVQFNEQINKVLKAVSDKLNKRIYTHSFRVTLVTELLQTQPIQKVKNIIGHKDIRTTEIYDRNFMGERELRKAIQHVYKKRRARTNGHAEARTR